MTILFNVTDAVGSASNHGITRTERKLGTALAECAEVEFVVAHRGALWTAPKDAVLERLRPGPDRRVPSVEHFGTGVEPAKPSAPMVRAVARRLRRTAPVAGLSLDVARRQLRSDDTLISVGLDWVHGTIREAERLVFGHGGRFIGCCYDTIPIDHPEWVHPPDPTGFSQHLARVARVASRVMCISQSTQRDFARLFPGCASEQMPVVRLGADAAPPVGAAELAWVDEQLGDEPYAVYCATVDRRKNHALLYRVAKEMERRGDAGRFVFVGMVGSGVDDLIDTMRHDRSIAGRIVHVMECDDAHLAAIYQRALFAVYPSLYEGWGLGVSEALAHGKSCIVASGSSLGEAGLGICPEIHPLHTADWADLVASYFDHAPALPPVELPTWESAARDVLRCAAA